MKNNMTDNSSSKHGLIMIPYAELSNYNTGVNLSMQADRRDVYLKNCCVACLSAKKNAGDSSDVALVTNFEVGDPYKTLLKINGIKSLVIPFDMYDFGSKYTWSLAFYKLCVLYHVSREYLYNYYSYLDADVYIQRDFRNIWCECDHHIMLYDINHGLQVEHYRHFLSEVNSFLGKETLLTHFGGEFFAANRDNALCFSEKSLSVFNIMQQNSFITTHGDEFIISVAALDLPELVKNAGAYIYRYWTRAFRLVSTNYLSNQVTVLHVPSEKEGGILKIYDYYDKHGCLPEEKLVWRILYLSREDIIGKLKRFIVRIIKRGIEQ